MESRKKILIIVFSNLRHDARVKRQISFLSADYSVSIVCFDGEEMEGVRMIRIAQTPLTLTRKMISGIFLFLGFYETGHRMLHDYAHIARTLYDETFDLVIANDVETLPLAFMASANQKVLLDAHEYAPRHFEDRLWWRVFFKGMNNFLCRKYIPRLSGMMTIGEGLAKEYERNFGTRPVVITNATSYHELEPSDTTPGQIRLVYHGIANPSRRIELMVEMMKHLDDRFRLDLILMTSEFASGNTKRYIWNLNEAIKTDERIRILPQLASNEVVTFINNYDVGVFLLPPVNFNYANTLPNKLFEYIQARLAIAVGPTPEMAAVVRKYNNGVVAEDFNPTSLAAKLSGLDTDTLMAFKRRSGSAAKELSAENNRSIFLQTIDRIIGQRQDRNNLHT